MLVSRKRFDARDPVACGVGSQWLAAEVRDDGLEMLEIVVQGQRQGEGPFIARLRAQRWVELVALVLIVFQARDEGVHGFGESVGVVGEALKALLDGGVGALLDAAGDFGAQGIEVDVGHCGEDALLVEKSAGVESPLEEVPFAAVLSVCAQGDGLLEMFHELGHGAEDGAKAFDSLEPPAGEVVQEGFAQSAKAFLVELPVAKGREGAAPSADDFVVRPLTRGGWVEEDDEMEVVAHDGVSVDLDGEEAGQMMHTVDEPAASMREIGLGEVIEAAEPAASDAARDEMVEEGCVGVDDFSASDSHARECRAVSENALSASADRSCRRGAVCVREIRLFARHPVSCLEERPQGG